MRIFVAFEDVRLPMDVQPGQTVGDVKTVLKDHFKLNSSHAEGKILRIMYAGAVLRDDWICSDVGITSASTIKSVLIDSDQPVLHIQCLYNGDTIVVRDQLNFSTTSVSQLQKLVSSKSGLPVTVFRLCTKDGRQMYGYHTLERYGIDLGSTIRLHVWDGWADLLKAATQGHTKKVLRNSSPNEQVAKYQFRVACFIAAHFGHVDLANSMLNSKSGAVRPEEPVGQHPSRLWSKSSAHVESWKAPVHEAVECGKLNVLRIFVQNNICCLIAKDGEGRSPMQVAFRYKQVECVQYLSSKLYSSHTENNVTLPVLLVVKTKKWSERAREQVLMKSGSYRSSPTAMVGNGILVDGFSIGAMNSKSNFPDMSYLSDGFCTQNSEKYYMKSQGHLADDRIENLNPIAGTGRKQVKYSESSDTGITVSNLPAASRNQQATCDTEESVSVDFRTNANSGTYLQTPKLERNKLPVIQEGVVRRKIRLRGPVEGSIPLPALSVENHLRPFFHSSSKEENPILSTLKLFDRYRQLNSRESAIQCMTMASAFKDKVWLRQVDLAISLARRGVSNSLFDQISSKANSISLPTIAASPIRTRE